jgi:uncharacterized protein (PEP-CTERM system associated)
MRNINKQAIALLLAGIVSATASHGAEIGGDIRVGVSRTDNVFLATSPEEIDDIVYQATPHLTINHTSPGFDAYLDYTFDWYRYSDLSTTNKFHRGEAFLTGRSWQDSLMATLGARLSQVLSDPEDVIPAGNLPLSGNLTDKDEYWFNPRLVRNVGRSVTVNADYVYSIIEFDDPGAQNNTNQLGTFSLDNYSAGQGLTWALSYDWRLTEYDVTPPWEYQRAKAELGVWVSGTTRLFAGGGKESPWDNPYDSSFRDSFWEAGFASSAGENLSAEFAFGERDFGSSWRGKLDYTFRRGSTSLSYVESPTTIGFNQPTLPTDVPEPPDDIDDIDDFDDFLSRPGGAQSFLSKRLEWSLDLMFRRTSMTLSLFDDDRSNRVAADGTVLDDQSASGVRLSALWELGTRTSIMVSGAIVDQELSTNNKSRWTNAELTIGYGLGARSSLSLVYSYSKQQPRGEVSTSRDYVANVVSLFFTLAF